jgi:uncharacterized protein YggE
MLGCAALVAPAAHAQAPAQRSITVVGAGTATAPNDTATVAFGVEIFRRTPAAALNATSRRTRRVIAAVTGQGVAAADIQTSQVGLHKVQRRVRGSRRRRVTGYRSVNRVVVTVRRIDTTGQVIAAAVNGGATSFDGVEFSASNGDDLYHRALTDAYRDARAKAEALAREAGVTLGGPLEIQEGVDTLPEPSQGVASPSAPASGHAAPPPIKPGTSTVDATVTVRFAISG